MSIEDEMAAVKAATEKKLRSLRERERRRQQAVDLRLLILLRSEHSGLANELEATARAQLAAETAERSAKAKASKSPRLAEASGGDAHAPSGGQSMEYTT